MDEATQDRVSAEVERQNKRARENRILKQAAQIVYERSQSNPAVTQFQFRGGWDNQRVTVHIAVTFLDEV